MMDLFLCFFPALPVVINFFFSFSFSNRFVVMSHHGFNLIFPIANAVEIPFVLIVAILSPFSMKCHFMSFAHFPVGLFALCLLLTLESSRYQTSVGYAMWKSFLPVCGLSFQSLASGICRAKVFNSVKAQFANFILLWIMFLLCCA